MFFLFSLITASFAEEDVSLLPSLSEIEILENEDVTEEEFHWQSGHEWVSLSLNRSIQAVSSTWNDRLLAMDQFGRIHRLEGDGSWNVVFRPNMEEESFNEEDLLLNVEGILQEQWDTVDDSNEEFDEDTEELIPLDSIENEWEVVIDDPLLEQEQASKTYSLWTDERLPLVFACYTGGCLRSDDNGDIWEKIEDLPPSSDFTVLNKAYLAATSNGVWVSENKGYRWRPAMQFPTGVDVRQFSVNSDYVLAATSEGLWFSIDGDYWQKIEVDGFESAEFEMVYLNDRNTILAGSDDGLLHSSSFVQSFAGLNAEIQPQLLLDDEWNSALIAFVENRVFESIDQGKVWNEISDDLPMAYIHDAVHWKGSFVVANDLGVFYIRSAQLEEEDEEDFTYALEQKVGLDTLIMAATIEINRQLDELEVSNRTRMLRWVPTFSIVGQSGTGRAISSNYDSISTTGDLKRPLKVSSNFCFGNCQSASTDVGFSNLSDSVMVVGDSVYRTDLGGVVPAASSVSLELKNMRRDRIQKIINLYVTVERLEQQAISLRKASLLERSFHSIEQMEVAAILDLYTEGKYSATTIHSKEKP